MSDIPQTFIEYNGRFFSNNETLEAYQKEVTPFLQRGYYFVKHRPDLSEGRGFTKITLVVTQDKREHSYMALLQYCMKTLGDPIVYVADLRPTPNWEIVPKTNIQNVVALKNVLLLTEYDRRVNYDVVVLDFEGKPTAEKAEFMKQLKDKVL